MAKIIKCNNCGAADVTKVNDHEFRCNYCQARIVTEDPKFDMGSFFKTLNPNDIYKRTQTTYHHGETVVKNTSRLGCALAGIILAGILAGIMVPFFIFLDEKSTEETKKTWRLSYTQYVYYTTGSKGPAVWMFREENFNWEKNRNVLEIVDPRNGKTLHTEIVIPEHTSAQNVAGIWDRFNGGRVFGDTIFFTPKGKGLEGRNIYTAKKIIGQDFFVRETGNELAEAYAYNSSTDPYIRVKSDEGAEYYYFPSGNKITTRDTYNKQNSSEKTYRYFFALSGNGDKKHIVRINQLAGRAETSASFYHSYRDFSKDKRYYSRYYNIQSIDSVPVNHGFFHADFITHNDTSFVIKYKPSLKNDAPMVIGCYGISGKNRWKIIPEQMDIFRPKKNTDKVSLNTCLVNGKLIISSNSPHAACCIDTGTGKIQWTHRVEK